MQGMSKCAHRSALTSEVPLRWDLLLLLSPYAAEKDRKDRREKTLVPLSTTQHLTPLIWVRVRGEQSFPARLRKSPGDQSHSAPCG